MNILDYIKTYAWQIKRNYTFLMKTGILKRKIQIIQSIINILVQMIHSQVIGEATPIYMYWNKSIERIYVYNPQIKLIIILRNPIDRAFSHWNMERDKGRESRTFLKAILDEESKINSPNYSQNKILSYLDRGYYSQQIKNIYNYFNKRSIISTA